METIKVNMNPNPLDVQTIHASQNDGEARQWEFELHNNGELIDTSDVKEQLVFKAYKGGTEQILPENTSTPTTSPFLGDIKYPQGLLTDQEFTYRQSPTESDGLAKITDIKGNTIVWNQIVKNDAAATIINGVTYTKSGNKWSASGTATEAVSAQVINASSFGLKNGHKYLCKGCPNGGSNNTYYFGISGIQIDTGNGGIWTSTYADGTVAFPRFDVRQGTTVNFTDMQFICVDLTQMFGPGNEPTTVEEFTSLFSLPYYAYNKGSLLSFNGNGIKTVGKNLLDPSYIEYGKSWEGASNPLRACAYFMVPHGTYTVSIQGLGTLAEIATGVTNAPYTRYTIYTFNTAIKKFTLTVDENNPYIWVLLRKADETLTQSDFESCGLMVETGSTATEYESYTESTLSLPISTYFPTGMKSAGSVCDELTESKAITRIGAVDLGTLEWSYDSSVPRFVSTSISSLAKLPVNATTKANLTTVYQTESFSLAYTGTVDKCIALSTSGAITLVDKSYTDAQTFKTAMSGVYLYYELKTPTETSFTTASLVTENAEIPLSNEDGVLIGKCTEQLSENPGFIDAKIKLSDADGECYSNKIQLHVERSPQ